MSGLWKHGSAVSAQATVKHETQSLPTFSTLAPGNEREMLVFKTYFTPHLNA